MKPLNLTLMGAALAVALCGCASSSAYKQADKTGKGIADFRAEVVNLKKAVDGSMALLGQTSEAAASDPRKSFEAFAKSVDKVEDARTAAGKRAADVKAAGGAYFTQWETELATINNPDIRKLAEQRKQKLQETFAKIGPLLDEAKKDFDPFLANLKDLRALLSQDLTVNGVDAAKGVIRKTRAAGAELQKALDELIDEMNTISSTLTASKAPPPAQ